MPVEIFCCYARKDQKLLQELKKYLIPLQRQGFITVWNDTDISPGTNWEEEINKHLDAAHIILLLISPTFMASDYCFSNEMQRAIERHKREDVRLIPVILRPVNWQIEPLRKLQALPKDAKPIKSWLHQDEAFLNVAEGIREVIEFYLIRMKDPYYAYTQATSKPPVLTESLSSQSASDWLVGDWDDSSFSFSEGAFHLTVKKHPILAPSIANATHFSDFAFQVEMTLLKGDGGGIVFRRGVEVASGYQFFVGRHHTELRCAQKRLFIDKTIKTLSLENDLCFPAYHNLSNQTCLLTVVAKSSDIFLYINRRCVAQVQDNTAKSGRIGLMAISYTQDTHVQFRNMQVWDLMKGVPSFS